MVSLVRDGVISPLELVDAHLEQIARRNPSLNAFVRVFDESAREEARALSRGEWRGLLHGIPVTVKDSFDVAGQPTRSGSPARPAVPAEKDAPAVARLRAAGAVILGRTNTSEMLRDYECANPISGRTNNPWDLERTPGGSSGGEAAAIAACCSAGGIGSDGGGSIRIPAHFCGIAGLKPTPGRIPATGHFPALGYPAGLVTTVGPMARSVKDLRLLFSVLAGYEASDPFSVPAPVLEPRLSDLRIGVWEQFYGVPVQEDVAQALSRAAGMLDAQGFRVDAFQPHSLERAPNLWAFVFGQWGASPADFTGEQILANLAERDRLRALFLEQLGEMEAIAMPVAGIPAFRHGEKRWRAGDREIGMFQAAMPAVIANVLGLPAVTLPIMLSTGGLPVGVQLVGRPFNDELLLAIALRLEEARGTWTDPWGG
jgi:Asp-tRNA(Asn)/Glu-tRNA(Gln) amidotransferase A subunit family amidase